MRVSHVLRGTPCLAVGHGLTRGALLHSAQGAHTRPLVRFPVTTLNMCTRQKQQIQTANWHFQWETQFVLTRYLSFWTGQESEQPCALEHSSYCSHLGHRGKQVENGLLFAQGPEIRFELLLGTLTKIQKNGTPRGTGME